MKLLLPQISLSCVLLLFLPTCYSSSSSSYSSSSTPLNSSSTSSSCSRCTLQGEAKARRLQEIKNDILHKLGLKQAPNVTLKELPRIPPVNSILGRYGLTPPEEESSDNEEDMDDFSVSSPGGGTGRTTLSMTTMDSMNGMVSDMPYSSNEDQEEYEDFLINSEKSISLARNREYICPSSLYKSFMFFSRGSWNNVSCGFRLPWLTSLLFEWWFPSSSCLFPKKFRGFTLSFSYPVNEWLTKGSQGHELCVKKKRREKERWGFLLKVKKLKEDL